ncbi:MAG: ABC transporter permease, partial [Polyangiales bacterium]
MGSESLRMALQVLVRNPGRSTLTVLGLAIGVSAFIAMVAFGQGARRAVLTQFENLGANMLRVRPKAAANDIVSKPALPLSDEDVAALRHDATAIGRVVPHVRRTADFAHGGTRIRSTLYGTEPDYGILHDFRTTSGGMFDERDLREASKVCVLGASVGRKLFRDDEPLGGVVMIAGRFPCRVVGVLQGKGRGISGSDLDDFALMPATTYKQLLGMDGYANIELQPAQPGWLETARKEADEIMRRRHRLTPDEPADFDVWS